MSVKLVTSSTLEHTEFIRLSRPKLDLNLLLSYIKGITYRHCLAEYRVIECLRECNNCLVGNLLALLDTDDMLGSSIKEYLSGKF